MRRFQISFLLLTLATVALLLGCGVEREVRGEPPPETAERGAELYNTYCLTCHAGATGGSMMDIPPRHNANGHTWHHPDCQLVDTIFNGSGEMGVMMRRMMGATEDTPAMPAWKGVLSEDDVAAILAYVKSWWTEGQFQLQAQATEQRC